jgi:hypothetical protein
MASLQELKQDLGYKFKARKGIVFKVVGYQNKFGKFYQFF